MMHETLLDQLPVLVELKQYVSRLTISGNTGKKTKNLILEDMPQIQDNLIKEVERDGGFYQVAQNQDGVFLNNNREEICALATKLTSAYGTEILCELEQHMADLELKKDEAKSDDSATATTSEESDEKTHKCGKCQVPAKKKCANCKLVHYCSRCVPQTNA